MSSKVAFISSTYKDLREYRRQVWDTLKRFDVAVRGMEEFGARTSGPLETCLAEVEQSDVYVGIIAYRLGSIDPETQKPFTLLEYEKAFEQHKEILIYVADDEAACFPQSVVDQDAKSRERLEAFKRLLGERHVFVTFSTPEDLVEKLSRDFDKRFSTKQQGQERDKSDEDVFAASARALKAFLLTPTRFNGHEVRLCVSFSGEVFPASRKLCHQFNLEYGFTVGAYMHIVRPAEGVTSGFDAIYATGNRVDALSALVQAKEADLYSQLQFTEEDVSDVRAQFFGGKGYVVPFGSHEVYLPAEGKLILLFTKPA